MTKAIIPSAPEIGREALIVVGGAIIGALIVGAFPSLQKWMVNQWTGAGGKDCACGGQ